MKAFATNEKRLTHAVGKTHSYVHHPIGAVQQAQQTEIHRILHTTGAQAKLTIGQPNDKYEQEADRVADQVMLMNNDEVQRQPEIEDEESKVQAKPLADQITPFVQRQEDPPEEEEEALVQAKGDGAHSTALSSVESGINSMRGNGQPLTGSSRVFFEPRMGADLSSVRIHTDSKASMLARSINARAFTHGDDMFFAAGQYSSQSGDSKKLLAHELTHTLQQKTNQSTLNKAVNKMGDLGKDRIQRAPDPKGGKLPTWSIILNAKAYRSYPGLFKWRYKGLFKATDIDKRFFIVQWMKGSVQGYDTASKKWVYPWKFNHLDKAKVKFNFPKWVVDAPSMKSAEYVGLTKSGDEIGFSDAPGVGQSASAAKSYRWPSGTMWKADMHFQIQVFSRKGIKGTAVSDFKSIDSPSSVTTVKWSWKDSYTIP